MGVNLTKEQIEYISGIVERVTYHNVDNGFCVLRVKVKLHKDLVTVVGNMPTIMPGEHIKASGVWHNNKDHGLQFKADFLKSLPPNTIEAIEKYLGSGLIKGVGPHFAKKLVTAFKDDVFDIIEHNPQRLLELDGVGQKRADSICKNWVEQKIIREIMLFLQSHGVGTARATRIYKTYGEDSIKIVSDNPYRLASDVRGIGFISADTIARNLGFAHDSLVRAQAGINHTLLEATSSGHCALPEDKLVDQAEKLLEIPVNIIKEAIRMELESNIIVKDVIDGQDFIFIASYYNYEKNIAKKLKQLTKIKPKYEGINIENAILKCEEESAIKLADSQKDAIRQALNSNIMVLTGGPGTGKTTIVNSLLKILSKQKLKIKLCAPTGRAAKRLSQATSMEATTIHRLLEIDPFTGKFKKNRDNPLECDCLVIDESSMLDVQLFYMVIEALADNTSLFLVGDVDQLPSVGAGNVLDDIINSNVIAVARLTEIFRQAKTSDIIKNAHMINQAMVPDLSNNKDKTDFYFIESDPDKIISKIITIIKDKLPDKFKLDPLLDVQVLCPMKRGGVGSQAINIELQKALNNNFDNGIEKYGQRFCVGDKVMQIVNDYDKEVYNGDIGYILSNDQEESLMIIEFDGRKVMYDYSDFDQLTLAYATTIHKSQGSEYTAVIIPITTQSFLMLKKNLIYTAVTRGKNLVVIIGQKKALTMAIKNTKGNIRYSKLKHWLIDV